MLTMQAEALVALLALLIVTLYAVFAGADFGGGVWDLFASGPRKVEQRDAIGIAMSPVWETNHVWLIYLVVLLFTCFPPVFAEIGERLFAPIMLALFGIVLRGAAFAFRGPPDRDFVPHRISGVFFGAASLITPCVLGACAAAIATGTFGWTRPCRSRSACLRSRSARNSQRFIFASRRSALCAKIFAAAPTLRPLPSLSSGSSRCLRRWFPSPHSSPAC